MIANVQDKEQSDVYTICLRIEWMGKLALISYVLVL